ncbi:hypothetical protein [Vibrio agarivorans]|uniref:Helix-turn-helix domain-containing protein n=1 Tax=Vibrio agarivorans TaxID=153622 RepID=A0ABT7Y0X8_9VIBR|nr:hypothetical protein [Vibrio agarivorans]MDN2481652.1 hypothetical protein [Vibrio agarivorans]
MARENKRGKTKFVGIPHYVMDSASYAELSGNAVKLLTLMLRQYNGHNNGNLTATWDAMQDHFGSNNTLRSALKSLQDNRLIELTGVGTTQRKGGKPPTLFAITWAGVDEYRGQGNVTVKASPKPLRTDWRPIETKKSQGAKTALNPPRFDAKTALNPKKQHESKVQKLHYTQKAANG